MKKILTASIILVILIAACIVFYTKGYLRLGTSLSKVDKEEIAKTAQALQEYFAVPEGEEGMERIAVTPAPWKSPGDDVSNFPETKIFNFRFKTPYGIGKESEKTKGNDSVKQIEYPNNIQVIATLNTQNAREELLQLGDEEFVKVFSEYLGDAMESNYSVREFILNATPAAVLRARSTIEAKAFAQAAVLKDASALDTIIGLYTFETPQVKGFVTVYENTTAVIEFFTENNAWYNIMLRKADVGTINAIISSLEIEKE